MESDNELYVKELATGAERSLWLTCDGSRPGWTPDGRFLIVSEYLGLKHGRACRPALYPPVLAEHVPLAPAGVASALSPDGHLLAYADGGALLVLRLDARYRAVGRAAALALEPRDISRITWAADSKRIVYEVDGDVPYLRRIGLSPASRPEPIPGLTNELSVSQFLADGTALATETIHSGGLWRAALRATPPKIEKAPNPTCAGGSPDCSPDGRTRAFITARSGLDEIWLSDDDGANERPLVRSMPGFVASRRDGYPQRVCWSPDGKWVAFTVWPVNSRLDFRSYLYVVPVTGGPPRRLGRPAESLGSPAWARDGRSIYAEEGIGLGTLAERQAIVRISLIDGKLSNTGLEGSQPHLSRDGRFLYFLAHPGFKLCRTPIAGGPVEHLMDSQSISEFAVGSRFVYFPLLMQKASGPALAIARFDAESKQMIPLVEVPSLLSLDVSPDERFVYFEQPNNFTQRVVLVRGLL